jgi:hypothetical protein
MFKKKDGTEVDEGPDASKPNLDEAAYEDSWYRSLKAMAETLGVQAPHDDDDDEDTDDEPGSEA